MNVVDLVAGAAVLFVLALLARFAQLSRGRYPRARRWPFRIASFASHTGAFLLASFLVRSSTTAEWQAVARAAGVALIWISPRLPWVERSLRRLLDAVCRSRPSRRRAHGELSVS